MKLFLDTSVLLAAAGSATGSSRALFTYAPAQQWTLLGSPYVTAEVVKNLHKVGKEAVENWDLLRPQLLVVKDVFAAPQPVNFTAAKDRPVLLTSLAFADVLLTLDKADFGPFLGGKFYGLPVLLPYQFLRLEREAGRLNL